MHAPNYTVLSLAISALIAPIVTAQTIRVGPPTIVATGAADRPLYEPHLAIDPTDPRRLVAASIVGGGPTGAFEERRARQRCATFVSMDAGTSWIRRELPAPECADPWVSIAPNGRILVTTMGLDSSQRAPTRNALIAYRSADGGVTWDAGPTGLTRSHDHPTTVADLSPTSPRRGWIYLTSHRSTRADDGRLRWGVYTARSRDGGRTFDDPVYVVPNNLHNLPEMPAVLRDGTLIVSFVDASHDADSGSTVPADVDFERRRAWIMRSTDGAHTFSPPLFVTDACGPPPSYRLSAFAADVSQGSFADRLYFACRERGGGPIVVVHSRDRGETWSPAVALRSLEADATVANRIPAIAVNDQGVVAVSWIDAPGGAGHRCEQRVYLSVSVDGGQTFSPAQLVSAVPVCPDSVHVPSSTGGDYFALAPVPGGDFRLLWSETRDGVSQLRTVVAGVARSLLR